MARLTPLGKAVIAIIALVVVAFIASNFLFLFKPQEEPGESTQELNVILVGKSFDENTNYLQSLFLELLEDRELGELFRLTVIDAELEPGKVEALGMNAEELPCYVIGTEKKCEIYTRQWYELKIREQSDILQMTKKTGSK